MQLMLSFKKKVQTFNIHYSIFYIIYILLYLDLKTVGHVLYAPNVYIYMIYPFGHDIALQLNRKKNQIEKKSVNLKYK